MKVIDILVVSDEWIARTGLKHLLAPAPGFQLVGEAATSEALQQATKLKPDVIVFHATERDSANLVDLVTQTSKRARTVLVGGQIHRIHLGSLLAAGALGYVKLEAGPQELFDAIRAAAKGHRFIDPGVSDDLFELFVRHSAGGVKQLSRREQQVLRMLAFGHTLKEIANELRISQKSVETYRTRIREKLDLRTRADIIRYALDVGLLTGPHEEAARDS
jgi:DNA-binding NarL/FixJ family response regulator